MGKKDAEKVSLGSLGAVGRPILGGNVDGRGCVGREKEVRECAIGKEC